MNEIKIYETFQDLGMPLTKELLLDKNNLNSVLEKINQLQEVRVDLSTKKSIDEAKAVKKHANAFIKALKDFCEPLESDGKAIADARSKITTTLMTGKDAVISKILKPIEDLENALEKLKKDVYVRSLSEQEAIERLGICKEKLKMEWYAYKDEAIGLLEQQVVFIQNEIFGFEKMRIEAENAKKIAEEAEKIRIEKIRIEAEIKAQEIRIEAERKAEQMRIDAEENANKIKEQAQKEAEVIRSEFKENNKNNKIEEKSSDIEHQRKINNEIKDDLCFVANISDDTAKVIIKAIVKGEIRNLKIVY
jgi:hypothetical protein